MFRKFAALALVATLLSSCAANQGPRTPGERFFRAIGEKASPSDVVAAELAFARMAREEGQWTAFRKFAADDALLFGQNGAIEAKPWLRAQQDPPEAVQWEPHSVWASCDGSLAVSTGGFVDPDGGVGRFHTVWSRQRNGEYRYVFDFGFPTATAPAEPDMIATEVADCDGATGPRERIAMRPSGAAFQSSHDGSLAWGFAFSSSTGRTFTASIRKDGTMKRVIDISLPPSAD